jgi:NAD kinase
MSRRIGVFGGSFDPPGLHHRHLAQQLSQEFDELIIVPCGPRPDKAHHGMVEPVYRAALNDLTFGDIDRVSVDLFDLEQATFTRTDELEARYKDRGEIWHIVGSDIISGGRRGESFIHRCWKNGAELWKALNFAVVSRPGSEVEPQDLPPQAKMYRMSCAGSAETIRRRAYQKESLTDLVVPEAERYIKRYDLYRGKAPARYARLGEFSPRPLVHMADRNPLAVEIAQKLEPIRDEKDPNCVIAIGGDGTMLHAIQTHWRKRIPFIGINAGHLGFLLNKREDILDETKNIGWFAESGAMVTRQLPMIYAETTAPDGTVKTELSFNDAWVERSTGQSAWLRISVDGKERIPKLVCDGLLVSTAAGSTAYAMSMGAQPLLADTPGWLIVGSNVMSPLGWKSALLPLEANVLIEALNTEKRPVIGFAHGVPMGPLLTMRARISRIASVELAFLERHDLAEKIAQVQFPGGAGARLL